MTHAVEDDLSHSEVVADQSVPAGIDAAASDNGLYENQFTDNGQWQGDNPAPSESEKNEEKVVTHVKKVKLRFDFYWWLICVIWTAN